MITPKSRAEADYYLSFTPRSLVLRYSPTCLWQPGLTEEDYEEWFLHDSRGTPCDPLNPILVAKRFYGILVSGERWDFEHMGMFALLDIFRGQRPLRFLDESLGLDRIKLRMMGSYLHTATEGYTWPGGMALVASGAPVHLLVETFGEERVVVWARAVVTPLCTPFIEVSHAAHD